MMKYSFLIIFSGFLGPLLGQTSYDVEYAQVCLIDSIAPDTINQFWRITQANNPGQHTVDMKWDMSSGYVVSGTVLPCCSCLTEATALRGAGDFNDYATANPPPINTLLLLSGVVLIALIIPARKVLPVVVVMLFPFTLPAQGQPGGTTYDIEYSCVCLVDSIATDTINQFWRFTQSNNPGQHTVDVTYDFSTSYTVSGTVLSCKDYYLGDNPGGSGTAGTLAMWTGPHALGNSSVTESGQILATSLTGAFHLPVHTTAGRPAGVSGYLAYNSTENGLEGYNGGNYYFLPWADADNWAIKSIPFSNGNQLTTDVADLLYDSGTDQFSAQYIKAGDALTSAGAAILDVRGVRGDHTVYISGTGTTTYNSSLFVTAADVDSWTGFLVSIPSSTKPTLMLGETNTLDLTSQKQALRIGYFNNTNATGNFFVGVDGGRSISWSYSRSVGPGAEPAYGYEAARITPVGLNIDYGHVDVGLRFYTNVNNTLTYVAQLDSAGMILPLYASGALTGTPASGMAFNSSGRIISVPEKWAAISTSTDGSGDIVVAHGMVATPTSVQVTITGTTPYVVTVHTIDATNFTVRFFDMAGAAVTSTAVTATWHAKT